MEWTIKQGDVMERLREMTERSIACCVTSPPYWGLRDYGAEGQIGIERTPEEYVAKLVSVFREVRRVLRDDGTLWLNLGDSYAREGGRTAGQSRHWDERKKNFDTDVLHARSMAHEIDLKPKDLVGIPWRVAFALQADGWYLRSDIIWAKPNPMPESVTDRPTKAHEYLFLLAKSQRYYFDQEAVREESSPTSAGNRREFRGGGSYTGGNSFDNSSPKMNNIPGNDSNPSGRNIRSVWTIATQPFPEAHFATFPEALVEPCIKAGSRQDDTILDPFTGSGTTGVVALKNGRSFVGIELNPAYVEMARRRVGGVAPLIAIEL